MQYKIPVQIENEDPIVFWLSLRQLIIVMVWGGLWYSLFTSLSPNVWSEMAAIPSIFLFLVSVFIAIFKYAEMTFVPFVLAFVRYKINIAERKWIKGIDSFQPIDIWYVLPNDAKKEDSIDFSNKIDQIKELDKSIDKI